MDVAAEMGCRLRRLLLLGSFCAGLLPGTTWYITVAGLGGEVEYETRFANLAKELDKSVRATPDVKVTTLSGTEATKVRIEAAVDEAVKGAKAEDVLVVTLIGHGTFDGVDYKFNIPGPDLTAAELAAKLEFVPSRRQVVINTTSASGASIEPLRRDYRAVITATRAGTEKNATVFGRFVVEAFRDPAADIDKNEAVSALEAFQYADKKTTAFYETQKRLATEHPLLEDTGKGTGVRAPAPDNGQGLLARQLPLLKFGSLQQAAKSPAKQALLAQRETIEGNIDKLKYEKAAMPADEYRKALGKLLLQLAQVQEEIDK
jgi:hypothetical protein